jgi:hypothetical protein
MVIMLRIRIRSLMFVDLKGGRIEVYRHIELGSAIKLIIKIQWTDGKRQ